MHWRASAARFGERPGEAAWRSLTVIRGLPALLDAARSSSLRSWVAGIASDADPHAIEAALRSNARALAEEVRLWMPAEWQAAVAWAGVLIDLPCRAIPRPRGRDVCVDGRRSGVP